MKKLFLILWFFLLFAGCGDDTPPPSQKPRGEAKQLRAISPAEIAAEAASIKEFFNTLVMKKIKSFPTKGGDQLKEDTTAGFAAWYRKRAGFTKNEFWYVNSAGDVMTLMEGENLGGIPSGSSGIAKSNGEFHPDLIEDQKEAMSYSVAIPDNGANKTNLANIKDIGSFPILWTKGLQTNGTWRSNSPWAGRGGHVLYNDGTIKWFENVKGADGKGVFMDSETGESTLNVKNAIPHRWAILTP